MVRRSLRLRFEQFRQASSIHGGVMKLCMAALGVKLSRVRIPSKRLRLLVYRKVFGKKYAALDEAEFEKPIWAYPSLNALFTRGVRPEFRPIPKAADQLVCPCDARVQEIGCVQQDLLVTVKGIEFTMASLLPGIDTRRYQHGHFAIFFLAPSDCHRVFSPHDGVVEEVIHVPGSRLLVHPPFQRKEYPVFSLNERVILRLATPLGSCVLVLVAGWGVGNITLPGDPCFRPRARRFVRMPHTARMPVKKGQWIATFELGSTAILITEPTAPARVHLTRDQKVKYGQPAFTFER
jgi:phosphatidylserine decarboxylase